MKKITNIKLYWNRKKTIYKVKWLEGEGSDRQLKTKVFTEKNSGYSFVYYARLFAAQLKNRDEPLSKLPIL